VNSPACVFDTEPDLVFDYSISKVICEIARDDDVFFILRVLSGAGPFR